MTENSGRIKRGLRRILQFRRGGEGSMQFVPVHLPDDGQEFLKPTAAMLAKDLRHARSGRTQALAHFRRAEALDGAWSYQPALDAYDAARQAADSPLSLMAFGVASIMVSKLAQAAAVFRAGIGGARGRQNSRLEMVFRINLGQVYSDLGEGCRARQTLEEAQSLSQGTGDRHLEQTCHLRLGHLCFIEGAYDEGVRHCDDVLQGSQLDPVMEAKSLYLKAVISMARADLEAGATHLESGMTCTDSAAPSFILVRLNAHMASLCQLRGQTREATKAAETALRWSRRVGSRHGEARCMALLAAIDHVAGGADDTHFRASQDLDGQLGYKRGIARSHIERARIHLLRGQLDKARAAARIASETATASGHKALYLEGASLLTTVSADIDNDEKTTRLNQFAATSRASPLPSVEISILQHLGSVHLAAGRIADASQAYEAALRRCEEIGMQLGQSQILAILAHLAEQQGHRETAVHYGQHADLVLPRAS